MRLIRFYERGISCFSIIEVFLCEQLRFRSSPRRLLENRFCRRRHLLVASYSAPVDEDIDVLSFVTVATNMPLRNRELKGILIFTILKLIEQGLAQRCVFVD